MRLTLSRQAPRCHAIACSRPPYMRLHRSHVLVATAAVSNTAPRLGIEPLWKKMERVRAC
eukprot:7832629-Alexandrium_andersonii.AAC.1